MKKTFIFNIEWRESLLDCPAEVRLEIYDCIVEYAASGTIPQLKPMAKALFSFIKRDIDYMNQKYEDMVAKRSLAGKKGMASRYNKDITKPNNVITNDNKPQQGLTNLTNNDDIINDDIIINPPLPPLGDDSDFEKFWDMYQKKVGDKEKIKRKWDKLPKKDKEKIFEYIPKYIQAQPDKKYRKNPETFLNNSSWNDELIFQGGQTIRSDPSKFFETTTQYTATIE